jgi:DNA-binding Lrp family transcriptional regulator
VIQTSRYHESLTERDRQLIQLLIENPNLTNAQIARLLGISKQAVSERRKKLEDEGVIQRYIFWNVAPRLRLTKQFEIIAKGADDKQVNELIDYLLHNWRVAFAWVAESKSVVCGIILTDQETSFVKVLRDEFPFIKDVKLRSIKFKKFLNKRIVTEEKNANRLREIALREASRLSRMKSVDVILFSSEPHGNAVNLVVLRNKRFHAYPAMTSLDKISDKTYVHILYGTYEILKKMVDDRKEREWIRNMQIIFAKNNRTERRIKYLLRLARHI